MKDHFPSELTPQMDWQNDMLNELRKINENLEQLALLLNPQEAKPETKGVVKRDNPRKQRIG